MNELGCSTLCFARMPRQDALRKIREMGFTWVDLGMLRAFTVGEGVFKALHLDALETSDDDVKRLRDQLDSAGLKLATLNAGGGYFNVAWERETGIAYARRCIEICRGLGGYAVTVQSGKLLRGTDWAQNVRYVAPVIRELASTAADAGVEFTLESPHLEMLTHNLKTSLEFFEIINHPALYVALDPSHLVVAEEDPVEAVHKLGSLIRHVHIRDGAGKSPVVVPGQGEINFVAFVRALREVGYTRPLMIELCQDESEPYDVSNTHYIADTESSTVFMRQVLELAAGGSSAPGPA
jgi:sugar phosphate isomerase/epimerase